MTRRYYMADCRLVNLALIPSKAMGKTEHDIYVIVKSWCVYNVGCKYNEHKQHALMRPVASMLNVIF